MTGHTTRVCEDCGGTFDQEDGRPYKHNPDIWLCNDCHDARMDDDEHDYHEDD